MTRAVFLEVFRSRPQIQHRTSEILSEDPRRIRAIGTESPRRFVNIRGTRDQTQLNVDRELPPTISTDRPVLWAAGGNGCGGSLRCHLSLLPEQTALINPRDVWP